MKPQDAFDRIVFQAHVDAMNGYAQHAVEKALRTGAPIPEAFLPGKNEKVSMASTINKDLEREIVELRRLLRSTTAVRHHLRTVDVELDGDDNPCLVNRPGVFVPLQRDRLPTRRVR